MRRAIFKYPVQVTFEFTLVLPKGAEVIHVDKQDGVPTMWILHDLDREAELRTFYVVGTGTHVPVDTTHLGTWQDPPFVWHLFQ